MDQRGVQRHGRQGKGLADAARSDAEPVRDRDGHPRLQPAAPCRRPAGRQYGRQQARLRVLRPAGHRQPRRHAQRGARVRRARDVVLPGRVPGDEACRHHTRGGARRVPRRVLPRLRARRLAGRPDVLHRRRRARQLPVPSRGACDPGEARLDAGRPAAALHRARPLRPAGRPGRRGTGVPEDDLGGSLDAAAAAADRRRARRADGLQPARPPGAPDDRRGRGRGARDRQAAARARLRRGEHSRATAARSSRIPSGSRPTCA